MRALVAALLALGFAAAAQPRDVLTIGITQYPSTLHPNIENMAAKSYVLGFTRRPLNARDADWALVCLLCETLPTLENGLAARETTPDGRPGIRVTLRLREGLRWGDNTPDAPATPFENPCSSCQGGGIDAGSLQVASAIIANA